MSKPLPVLLAMSLLALSVVAAARGMADIYRREASMLVGEWFMSQGDKETQDWTWEQAHRYLWLANRLAPFDPQILSDMGQLYELRDGESPRPEASADLERALGYYRQALALHPTWPDAWANVALAQGYPARHRRRVRVCFAARTCPGALGDTRAGEHRRRRSPRVGQTTRDAADGCRAQRRARPVEPLAPNAGRRQTLRSASSR